MVSPCLHVIVLDYFSQTQFPLAALLAGMVVHPETVARPPGVSVTVDTSWEGLEDFAMVGGSERYLYPQYISFFSYHLAHQSSCLHSSLPLSVPSTPKTPISFLTSLLLSPLFSVPSSVPPLLFYYSLPPPFLAVPSTPKTPLTTLLFPPFFCSLFFFSYFIPPFPLFPCYSLTSPCPHTHPLTQTRVAEQGGGGARGALAPPNF